MIDSKEQIAEKLLRRIKGSYYFAYGKQHNVVTSIVRSCLKESESVDDLIKKLLAQDFMSLSISITHTSITWDLTVESFLEFAHNNSGYDFSLQSLNEYIDTSHDDSQSPFLIEHKSCTATRLKEITRWLKS